MNKAIKNIGIIGMGKMGTDLLSYLTSYDFNISCVCRSNVNPEAIQQEFNKKMNRQLKFDAITKDHYEKIMAQTLFSNDLNTLKNSDLIIEAIREDFLEKILLFEQLNLVVNSNTLIASNTSSILPSELSDKYAFPENVLGLHFFYPTKMKNIIEIIALENTSSEAIRTAISFCQQINRNYILQNNENAFCLNKIALEIQNEGFKLLEDQHLSYEQIDRLVKLIFPIGVFDFFDAVGIDVMYASIVQYSRQLNTDKYGSLLQLLKEFISNNTLGRKSNIGFYDYSTKKETPNSDGDDLINTEVLKRIQNVYICAAQYYAETKTIEKSQLNDALKEYFGMEKGPFDFIN